jgi:hypothetical protein
MCGRYYRRSDKQRIAEAFKLGQLPDDFVLPPWDYNVAPTTFQPVTRHTKETGERELVMMRWGMVPHFAKSLADFKGMSTINAKAETLIASSESSSSSNTSNQAVVVLIYLEGHDSASDNDSALFEEALQCLNRNRNTNLLSYVEHPSTGFLQVFSCFSQITALSSTLRRINHACLR